MSAHAKRGDQNQLTLGEMIGREKHVRETGVRRCPCGTRLRRGNKGPCSLCQQSKQELSLAGNGAQTSAKLRQIEILRNRATTGRKVSFSLFH